VLVGDGGPVPPAALVLAGAAALGASMGAVLGAAQALVLHGIVRHPWRWVPVSTLAWAPAMAVIFFDATTPAAGWPVAAVLGLAPSRGWPPEPSSAPSAAGCCRR
jgi:hypothetical protein